jgi:septum formation inhibitor MinC
METREILYDNENIIQLQEMFPDVDPDILYGVFIQCDENIQDTIECLFLMKSDQPHQAPPKESFMGLDDQGLDIIRRDLQEEQKAKLEIRKREDEEIQKAINESMKQLKIDEKKHEKEAKKQEKEENAKRKQETKQQKPTPEKKTSFGQKLKNLFSRKKKTLVETPEDIEIPDIKH